MPGDVLPAFSAAQRTEPARWLAVLMALVILYAGNSLYRNKTAELWSHPDQAIPVKVLQGMHQRGDLDTDWAKADLRDYFRVCRYNFSGYMLFAYAATTVAAPQAFADEHALVVQLQRFSRVLSTLTLVLVFLLLVRHLGLLYGIAGAAAVAAVPQLFQDATYARPEALSTFCFTLCFAIASLRPSGATARVATIAMLSAIAGFLASIKITYAVAGLFVVPLLLQQLTTAQHNDRTWSTRLLLALVPLSFLAGFAAGAPAVLSDPQGFLAGLEALQQQYAGGHPPHGRMEDGVAAQGEIILSYYLSTLGLLVLALHAIGYASKTLAPAKYAYATIMTLTIAGFLLQKVFFERNFSLLIPAFIVIAMVGLANAIDWLTRRLKEYRWHSAIAIGLGACLFSVSQLKPLSITRDLSVFFSRDGLQQQRQQRQEREAMMLASLGADGMVHMPYSDVFARRWPHHEVCTLYVADTFGDDWSARFVRELPARYRVIDVIPSVFSPVPASTLHTYHSPTRYLFVDATLCRGRRGQTPRFRHPS